MAEISASLVKDLRERTGAGMMDCKKALAATEGDLEAAIDWLRKKGLSQAAKKADRVAAEGLVAVAIAGTRGALVEVNSETDFVARNEGFQEMVRGIAAQALATGGDVETLKAATLPSGRSVAEELTHQIATIGENMSLRRVATLSVGAGQIVSYVHTQIAPGLGKIGVLVAVESGADAETLTDLGRKIAMHVAARNPAALSVDQMPADFVERERTVQIGLAKENPKNAAKPDEIIGKMIEGRMRKFFEENALLEQGFIMDDKLKVKDAIAEAAKAAGQAIAVTGYVRFQLGEGIQKAADDFAEEVAKLSK